MTKHGHLATGWAVGIANAAWLSTLTLPVPTYLWPILGLLFAIPGATAPDWLEIVKWSPEGGRSSLIKHRTWTHYPYFWLIGLIYGYQNFSEGWPILVWSFCLGGLTHLLVDLPNPMGIPFKWPTKKRWSLNWWRSGEMEFLIIVVFFTASIAFSLHITNIMQTPWIQSLLS